MKNYKQLSDQQKTDLLKDLYENQNKSFSEIAKIYNTYASKLSRDAAKYGIKIKTKSEAQKLALSSGKSQNPTKGKQRTEEDKRKIGKAVYSSWQNIDEKTKQNRAKKSKEVWNKRDQDNKQNMMTKANQAVRQASVQGSKLEKFFLAKLLESGYRVDFHKKQALGNTNLEIDLFLPTINTAIEVDGPSHFEDIWGEEKLKKSQKYDNKKSGLIIGRGWYLIRVKQTRRYSDTYANILCDKLITKIESIKNNQNSSTQTKEILIEE